MYDYGREKKLDSFISVIDSMNIVDTIIDRRNQSFSMYVRKHYSNKKEIIYLYLNESGYEIIEIKDKYSEKSKYVKRK